MKHLGSVLLVVAVMTVLISWQASGKTLNLIDIYREEVFDIAVLRNRKPVIVFYSKGSCSLCSRLQKKMEKIAKNNSESIYLARVDFDKLPELREKMGISKIPTMQAYYKGEMLGEVSGFKGISMRELAEKAIANYLLY